MKEISTLQFSFLTCDEIYGMSCVEITSSSVRVNPTQVGGMYDLRMGAMRNLICKTCFHSEVKCPGHFGHIKLNVPVLNPATFQKLKAALQNSACFGCFEQSGHCTCHVASENKRRKVTKKISVQIRRSTESTTKNIFVLVDSEKSEEISVARLYELLERAQCPDLNILFLKALPVMPNQARPPEMNHETGVWNTHPTTLLYLSIIKANFNLRYGKEKLAIESLQNAVNMLYDAEDTRMISFYKSSSVGGIRQRIDGKAGRMRMNMMGKRTDFSARTVLSGDPTLALDEIGVPKSICDTLTMPERIHQYNIQSYDLSNVKYVIKPSGQRFDYSLKQSVLLEIGDVVERSLRNGDLVIVNRQPTLHRGSMIACRVRVSGSKTFSLNYSTMVPLNADTDGDEINIHVPQNIEARAELVELMRTSVNIVSSQASKPLMGCTQDSLLGCYMMSGNDAIPTTDFLDILYDAGVNNYNDDLIAEYKDRQPGRSFLSHILHNLDVTVHYQIEKSRFCCQGIRIMPGAIFDKAVVGSADGSIIHHVFITHGHEMASKLIHSLQQVANAYLSRFGATMGIGDCIVNTTPFYHTELNKIIHSDIVNNSQLPDEELIIAALNDLNRRTDALTNTKNNLSNIIKAGSKGSVINFNQITQAVGQQIINAGRVPMSNRDRTLAHFPKHDYGLYSRGFIANSFIKGMNSTEVYFHAMSGRVGIIDTACKTADTGAQSRRLVKCLENLIVVDAGSGKRPVFDRVTGNVIQFEYGIDGLDGTYLTKQ